MTGSFTAPWSRLLKGVSAGGTALLVIVAFVGSRALDSKDSLLALVTVGGPLVVLVASLLFTIRGYEIAGDELLVRRLLWDTRLPLTGLRSVRADSQALARSLRLFGNGGLFSFSGLFRNKTLGSYRAFVTDHANAVVLGWDERTVVVSPGEPERFVAEIERRRGLS